VTSPLVFNDTKAAEQTLAALQAKSNIVYALIDDRDDKRFAEYAASSKSKRERAIAAFSRSSVDFCWLPSCSPSCCPPGCNRSFPGPS
jgi:hypothetical protein